MNKIFTAVVLSFSAFAATSAMADSRYNHHNDHRYNGYNNSYNNHDRWDQRHNNRWNNNSWRSGHYFPNQYHSSRYVVNYKNYRHLSKPSRYQQWYKVNGDYVLVNQRDHRIIRVVR
ncbi:RcnB family protein [Acinetobacter gerneri]|uniref:RcnB family protein n=1 Tax=Acinetobacter gerneri TaxID=202952 RepID=UPI003A85C40D